MRYQPMHEKSPRARPFPFHGGTADWKATQTRLSAHHQVVFTQYVIRETWRRFPFFHPTKGLKRSSRRGWDSLVSKLHFKLPLFRKQ